MLILGGSRYGIPQTTLDTSFTTKSERSPHRMVLLSKTFSDNRYATSPELNSFSALIQNFYYTGEGGTFPQPCIHLTLSTDPASPLSIKTYISTTVGVSPERGVDSCLFVPVSHEVNYSSEADRAGLELIASAKNSSARTAPLLSDAVALAKTLEQVHGMIVRVQSYIRNLLEKDGWDNPEARKIGRSLMETLALAPRLDAAELERMFNSHLQDVLMVVYLSNLVRSQFDVANRLAVVVT
jgi:translation initiation factor 3 subunit F